MTRPTAWAGMRQAQHISEGGWQVPSPSKGHKDTSWGAHGRGSVRVAPCLGCVCFGVGKANEIKQERSRVQMAASTAGGGLWCLAPLESQHGRESVAPTAPIDTPMEKSGQKPAMELAGKAEEEIPQVKRQDQGSESRRACVWK